MRASRSMSSCDGWSKTPRSTAERIARTGAPGRDPGAARLRGRPTDRAALRGSRCSRRMCRAAARASAADGGGRARDAWPTARSRAITFPTVIGRAQGRARCRRQCGRLSHRLDRAGRRASRQPRGSSRAAGVTGPHAVALPRRRGDARAAQDQSLDRRRHRAQALSRRAADRHQGARGLRALAAGRPGLGDRRRRHRARALSRSPPDRHCRWWSAVAPRRAPRNF